MKLQGKVAIVTGGARDLGRAISIKFAQEGAKVVVNYFDNPEDAAETLKLIPCHSVVMGKGVSNGIIAFVVFLWIFIKVYKLGLKGLSSRESPYNVYLLWTIISSFQLLLFGPPAVLKNNGSIAFAVMLALFYLNYLQSRKPFSMN